MNRLMVKSAEESVTAPLPNRPARMLIARRHARLAIMSRVFVKIASGRAKPFWVEVAFALGKHHPNGFSTKLRQNGKNLFRWRPLLYWGSTTQMGFRQNCVRTNKTFLGGVHFRVGEAPPVWVFGKITSKRQKPFWVEAAFVLGKHLPNGLSAKSHCANANRPPFHSPRFHRLHCSIRFPPSPCFLS